MNLSIHFVLRFQHLCRRLWTALLLAVSLLLLPSGFAAAQSAELSASEKAMVHLLLSQTGNANIRAMGGGGFAYADAKTEPYRHFKSDVSPWIELGARRGDSRNPEGRIKAYVADLETGLIKTQTVWPSLTEAQITAAAAQDLPIVWEQVLENEDAREILSLISGDAVITEDTAKKPLKAVRKQLQKIY